MNIFGFKKASAKDLKFNQLWNEAVALKRPTFEAFEKRFGLSRAEPVFDNAANIFCISANLFFRLPPGRKLASDSAILSVFLVTVSNFFKNSRVSTESLGNFAFLNQRLPCSAQTFLEHLKATDQQNITSLSTMPGKWVIDYGNAVQLTFGDVSNRNENKAENPQLKSIEFFFSMPYTGNLNLLIKS